MNAFIKCLLGFDGNSQSYVGQGGILGHVKGYYSCIEAQGQVTFVGICRFPGGVIEPRF